MTDRRAVTRLIWAMWGMPIVQLTPVDAASDPRGLSIKQAERVGFEPTVDRTADNGFRGSTGRTAIAAAQPTARPGECEGE